MRRRLPLGGADFYGEEHILADFARHLRGAGEEQVQADWMVAALTLSDFRLRPTPLEDVQAAVLAPAPEQGTPTVFAPSDAEGNESADYPDCEEDADHNAWQEHVDATLLAHEDVKAAADSVEAAVPPPPTGFVISKTKRGKFRRLHLVPVCRLVPGVHYKDFDAWGDELPKETDFHAVCVVCDICLPNGRPFLEQPLEEALLGSPSSSSSGEDEAAPAAPLGLADAMDGPVGLPGALAPP